jgi:hypothetical protein
MLEFEDFLFGRDRVALERVAAGLFERRWRRDQPRSLRIARAAYLRSPDERPLWIHTRLGNRFETLGAHRAEFAQVGE